MSAPAAVTEQRREMLRQLGDLIYRMLSAAARKDEAAPVYTVMVREALRQGIAASETAVKEAIALLISAGRIARIGRTSHQGYILCGSGLRTQSSCQASGSLNPRSEPVRLRCPTLEERAEMFGGERPYADDDVVPVRGRDITGNAFLEAQGWTSPLADL